MDNEQLLNIVNKHFATAANGELLIGGVAASVLAGEHRTPLYVYDEGILETQYRALRDAYPSRFEIYYSIKANPHPAILSFFLKKGCGLEIASLGEMQRALAAGCSAEKIIFAGPGKTIAELQEAIGQGIGEIHAESLTEIRRISEIAQQHKVLVNIALRINPEAEAQGGAMRMGGKPTPFGIDEAQMADALTMATSLPGIAVSGIHLFIGTQNLDADVLLRQYRKGLEIAARATDVLGEPLHTIDFGGGLGIPYFAHEMPLDLAVLAAGLREFIDELNADPRFRSTRLIIEPGRFLTGEAGIYITRINDIKVSRGKKFLIVDGGMHHHLAASGNLGQTIKRNYPVALLNAVNAPAVENVDVVGPLCTPLDVLARNIGLPEANIGDLVGVFQSGAYALTASPTGFLSHPLPGEVYLGSGERRRLLNR